jgi:hypothetical protein
MNEKNMIDIIIKIFTLEGLIQRTIKQIKQSENITSFFLILYFFLLNASLSEDDSMSKSD